MHVHAYTEQVKYNYEKSKINRYLINIINSNAHAYEGQCKIKTTNVMCICVCMRAHYSYISIIMYL